MRAAHIAIHGCPLSCQCHMTHMLCCVGAPACRQSGESFLPDAAEVCIRLYGGSTCGGGALSAAFSSSPVNPDAAVFSVTTNGYEACPVCTTTVREKEQRKGKAAS